MTGAARLGAHAIGTRGGAHRVRLISARAIIAPFVFRKRYSNHRNRRAHCAPRWAQPRLVAVGSRSARRRPHRRRWTILVEEEAEQKIKNADDGSKNRPTPANSGHDKTGGEWRVEGKRTDGSALAGLGVARKVPKDAQFVSSRALEFGDRRDSQKRRTSAASSITRFFWKPPKAAKRRQP
jgi:hypothetical protein